MTMTDEVVDEIDIFTSATSIFDVITLGHRMMMKNNAIICNIGHFDNVVDMAGLAGSEGIRCM